MDREVLLEHAVFLRRLARSLVDDDHGAEDVVQETYVAALSRPPRDPGSVRGWLARVTRNLALTARRAGRRRGRRERVAARPEAEMPVDEAVARLEVQRQVVDAVLALEEPYRSAVIHRYFYDRSLKGISRALGVPVPTVRTRLARALERLRGRLDREHGGDRRTWSLALLALLPRPGAAGIVEGVLLMTTKIKIAAGLLLVVGLLWLVIARAGSDETLPRSEPARAAVAERAHEAPPGERESEPTPAPPDRDRDVFGVVVGPTGAPVAAARVRAVVYPGRRAGGAGRMAWLQRARPSATTREDGTFVIRLTRGELVTLQAEAPGLASIEMDLVQAGEQVRLVLGRPVRLRVIVRDPDGSPVPGDYVRVHRVSRHDPLTRVREAITDAAGRCVFDNLPGGCHAMVLVDGAETKLVPLPEEGETEHVATVPVAAISGRVTDAATGAPIPGAVVRPRLANGPGARTGAAGRYQLAGAKDFIEALSDGHAPLVLAVEGRTMDFQLQRGGVARGRLVDARGNAVAGALVWAAGTDFRHRNSTRYAQSDDAGGFELRGLHPKLQHTLVVTADGFGRTLLDFPAGDFDFGDIVIPVGRSIEGRLVDVDGEPVARSLIELKGANEDRGRLLGITGIAVRYGNVEQRYTDDLGRFRFPNLAPARYLLTARRGRSGPKAQREVRLTARADVLDAHLSWGATRDFRVHVQDEEGKPLARVIVHVNRQLAGTDRSGVARFQVDGAVQWISVNAHSSRNARPFFAPPPVQQVPPGLSEYRFTVLRAGTATGRAVDASGQSLRQAAIEVRLDGKLLDTTTTDPTGRFTAKVPVTSGADLVLVGGFEGRLAGVGAGATNLLLRATGASTQVRLRVLDPEGRPVPALLVRAGLATGRTDAQGRVALAAPRGKEVTVELWLSSHRKAKERWVPPPRHKVLGGGEEIVLAMRRGVPIRGVVERPHDKEAGGVSVAAYRGEERVAHTSADESGRFVLVVPDDGAGPFAVHATDGKWRSESSAGVLPGATGVRLRLDRSP